MPRRLFASGSVPEVCLSGIGRIDPIIYHGGPRAFRYDDGLFSDWFPIKHVHRHTEASLGATAEISAGESESECDNKLKQRGFLYYSS
jgi:hypothetical protein